MKYVVHQKHLGAIFHEMIKDFDILTIDKKNVFKYESIYMDTPEHDFYHAHNRGEKDRIKVRTRRYMDSDLTFFEFKHRDHDVVRKYRYAIDMSQHGQVDETAKRFVRDTHNAIYGTDFEKELVPSMVTKYKRITLVHKNG
ncbi:MAG: VTC domain-containing protein [Candidatus Peribacteria bacterium]|nr:MAG: VTC domain-containing protein [Candidatus Peribacteria bacterium]